MATTSSALLKTILHKALAEGVYKDVSTRTSQYYYFLGKTLEWNDEANPPAPIDSYSYERQVRDEIITMKQIGPSDVSFVVPRINWTTGEIYDMYDDEYSTEVIGIDIVNGGTGYTSLPTITITGGGGTGAKYYPIISDGSIIDIEVVGIADTSRGYGYVSEPTVTVTGGGGEGAELRAVVNIAPSGAQKLEDAQFYVMTEDFNVYKCLDNNNGAQSMNKPLGTSTDPIFTDDGYVWKYMFTLPINLRGKFLSDEYIPVTSALTNQFYSNGTVDTIIINNKGVDYTYANIAVTSDSGYLEADPTYLTSLTISNGGADYSDPEVVFGDPVSDANIFNATAQVLLGQKIKNSVDDFYEVVAPGTLGSSEPTHRYGTVMNGTSGLKYIGTKAKGTVNLDGDAIDSVTLLGGVRDIVMSRSGSGYLTPPTIYFDGDGSGAIAKPKMISSSGGSGGSVVYSIITNPGENYTTPPTVTFGEPWEAGLAVLVNEQFYQGDHLYTVTNAGTFGVTAPSHTSGSATNGTATLAHAGLTATGETVLRYGAGYSAAPTITFSDPTGSGVEAAWLTARSAAKLLPVIDNGQIVDVIVQDAGVGYSSATLTVTGDGSGAELVADLSIGSINTLQANNEILTTPGTIDAIAIISGGYDYGVANITIEGDGEGATAEAIIDTAVGKITKINITNRGTGYTFADIVITGNGNGARARAIMPPFGGHGKSAPEELFSTTLMFYSNVSTDLNQGVAVNNDYRQIGIIKNPRKYGDNTRFTNQVGSACFLIQSPSVDTASFVRDTDVITNRVIDGTSYERNYRVVTSSSTAVLLQSLDNDEPQINDTFQDAANHTFTVSSVSNPTVDKYSGQLMFIDNKAGFTPSADETVTLRTVIKF